MAVRYKKLSEMREYSPTMDYNLWRCKYCEVGVLTRDREGHLRRCREAVSRKPRLGSHFRFDRDLAA